VAISSFVGGVSTFTRAMDLFAKRKEKRKQLSASSFQLPAPLEALPVPPPRIQTNTSSEGTRADGGPVLVSCRTRHGTCGIPPPRTTDQPSLTPMPRTQKRTPAWRGAAARRGHGRRAVAHDDPPFGNHMVEEKHTHTHTHGHTSSWSLMTNTF